MEYIIFYRLDKNLVFFLLKILISLLIFISISRKMNKKEKLILLNTYKEEYVLLKNGFDYKIDSIRTLKNLLNQLGLSNNRIEIENNIYFEINNIKGIAKAGYERLIEIIAKYNNDNIINVEDIEEILLAIEFELTEEHKGNIEACYKLINEE